MKWRSELQSILLVGLLSAAIGSVAWAAGEVVSTTDAVWMSEGDQTEAYFGESIGTAGDVNGDNYDDFIIGARLYDNGLENAGVAWLFYGSDNGPGPTPDVVFNPPSVEAHGFFGDTAAWAGDVNGDGYDDVLIALPNYSGNYPDEGAVYVYYGANTGIDTTPDWRAEGEQTYAHLGWGAGRAGDVNNDGYDDIIVGAYRYDTCSPSVHHAYVFHGSPNGLDPGGPAPRPVGYPSNADWTAVGDQCGWGPDPPFNVDSDAFGIRVGAAGDVNGDTYDDVFIGAPLYGISGTPQRHEGKVFVYHGSQSGLDKNGTRPTGSPSNADWAAESDQVDAFLGGSSSMDGVGFTGDVNCDGYDDLLVGSANFDHPESNEGMAFLWLGSMNGLNAGDPAWSVESNLEGSALGNQVGWAGDLNGDGCDDFMVAHHGYDTPVDTNIGRTGIYFGNDTSFTSGDHLGYADVIIEGHQASCFSGITLGTAGDVDGDGYDDFLIGAMYYDDGQTNEGAVFGFTGGPVMFFGNFETGNLLRWTSTSP